MREDNMIQHRRIGKIKTRGRIGLGAGQISGTPLSGYLPASEAREEEAKNFVLRSLEQGCSKVAAKALAAGKFSGFLPKAATTLERPCPGEQASVFVFIMSPEL
jgi:hypothetical protein